VGLAVLKRKKKIGGREEEEWAGGFNWAGRNWWAAGRGWAAGYVGLVFFFKSFLTHLFNTF
jgi:hypothetical protein